MHDTKRSSLLSVVCLIIAAVIPAATHAGVPSTAKDANHSPLLFGAKQGLPDTYVLINGHKAAANTILARFNDSVSLTSETENLLSSQGVTVDKQYTAVEGLVRLTFEFSEETLSADDFKLSAGADLSNKIKALEKTGKFEYVEPDWIVHVLGAPNDTGYTSGWLWGLNNQGQYGGTAGIDINVVSAWSRTTGDPNVVIGVVDTGIRYTHQDLAANMWTNPNEIPNNGLDDDDNGYIDDVYGINAITGSGDPFDDHNHGTHCAGTIAGAGNNTKPLVGVAYTAKVMGLKFLSSSGSGSTSNAVESIQYALNEGVDILSNSWGGGGYSRSLLDVIEAANDQGVLFIAAAGNQARNTDSITYYPQGYNVENVISVTALTRTGNLAYFSNYGVSSVDIAAPGLSIYSATASSDSSYAYYSGTSMATPHVAGVAALLRSEFPDATVEELRSRILDTAAFLPSLNGKVASAGMVDTEAAFDYSSDGILEVLITNEALVSGQEAIIEVEVSDLNPVTNAQVSASFTGNTRIGFIDNGSYPDSVAGDAVYSGVLTTPTNVSSVTFSATITAPGKQTANEEVEIQVSTPPENDDFADRILLVRGASSTSGTNFYATSETSEPRNPSSAGRKSVWWEWVAPEGIETATITTIGSNFDTTLAVYTGSSLSDLTLLGSNDDSSGLQSSVTFTTNEGQAYQIQVDGFSGREGDIQLNYPEPDNDSDVPVITSQPFGLDVLADSAFSLNVEVSGAATLVYQWYKLIGEEYVAIDGATASTFSVNMATIDDQGFYYVGVQNDFGSVNSTPAFVSVNYFGLQPPNDDFSNAKTMFGGSSLEVGSNALATRETREPLPAQGAQPVESIWYSWTSPADGSVEFSTKGSDFDTILAVFEGAEVSSLTPVASNDDAGPGALWSQVTFDSTGGTEYRIVVDGYSDHKGQVRLSHTFTGDNIPDNDSFERATVFNSAGTKTGSNVNASGEGDEPDHAGVSTPLSSVWWKWVSPRQPGDVTVSTSGSNFDTTLAIYTGDNIDSLQLVAENDDFVDTQSQVTFSSEVNTTYFVAVDGADEAEGEITLTISFDALEGTGAAYDYDGDGTADLAIRRPNSGRQFLKLSRDGSIQRYAFGSLTTDIPVAGDFDDDGINDLAVFRTTDGSYYILKSSDQTVERKFLYTYRSYRQEDYPIPADYDGDGVTDVAIYKPYSFNREWLLKNASGGNTYSVYFGPTDGGIPVSADYDGDGIADLAVWQEDTGYWFTKRTSDRLIERIIFDSELGDIPVPADYDGDRITDIALRRPSTGMWYIRYSSTQEIVRSYFGSQSTDIPVPADYDGDGKADIAIRRPNSGQIVYAQSGNNNAIRRIGFGSESTDMPIAAPIQYRMELVSSTSGALQGQQNSHLISDDNALEFGDYAEFEVLTEIEAQRVFKQEYIEEESMH